MASMGDSGLADYRSCPEEKLSNAKASTIVQMHKKQAAILHFSRVVACLRS